MNCPRFLLLALSLWLQGCVLLPIGGEPTAAPGGGPSTMRKGLRDYRVSFHCHCHLSHDSEGKIETIAAAAKKQGLNAVLLTDHYEPGNVAASPRGLVDGVLFVPGLEEGMAGNDGAVMGVGLTRELKVDPRPGLPKRLRGQGAFVVAGHIERVPDSVDFSIFDGIEIYNLHAEFQAANKVALIGRAFVQTRDTFLEGTITNPVDNLARWDRELAKGLKLVPLTGHDAHDNIQALGLILGSYAELFRLFSTRVLATELSEKAILAGLRSGHVYLTFDYLGDAAGFALRVTAPGGAEAIVGETLRWVPGAQIEVRLPVDAEVRVLRDGKLWLKRPCRSLSATLPGGGIYRVEVYRDGKLWILPAPIYVLDGS